MLEEIKIGAYLKQFPLTTWTCSMPEGCPPETILVAHEHPFFRLAQHKDSFNEVDFMSYAELNPTKDWGEMLPLAVGLSVIDSEAKARNNLRLPMFKRFQGIIALTLNPQDGVLKQTGVHNSHYTWWRTTSFTTSNAKNIAI